MGGVPVPLSCALWGLGARRKLPMWSPGLSRDKNGFGTFLA